MEFSEQTSEESRPVLTWQDVFEWAQTHYRDRIFRKDEQIPTRPELIYLVNKGAVRLVSEIQNSQEEAPVSEATDLEDTEQSTEAFLGFIVAGKPFEIVTQSSFHVHAYAHVDHTQVAWFYWQDFENWTHFRHEIYEAFRYQHQRKLLWLSALGQRRTIDRLTSFLTLLVEEYGESYPRKCCLPHTLTHAQIGSAIGSTRVTVTRLMGKLRRQGIITISDDNLICINNFNILEQKQQ